MYLEIGFVFAVRKKFKWSKPLTWLALLIRYFAKVKWNHVGVAIFENMQWFILEATEKGVIKTPIEEKINGMVYGKDYIYLRPTYYYNKNLLLFEANQIKGKKYDFWTLIIVELFWNTLHIWIGARDEKHAMRRFICYEVVWYLHRRCVTFCNKWWESMPSWLFSAQDFHVLQVEPVISNYHN